MSIILGIEKRLTFEELDGDGDVELNISHDGNDIKCLLHEWISREDAIKLINHLTEQFKLKEK